MFLNMFLLYAYIMLLCHGFVVSHQFVKYKKIPNQGSCAVYLFKVLHKFHSELFYRHVLIGNYANQAEKII